LLDFIEHSVDVAHRELIFHDRSNGFEFLGKALRRFLASRQFESLPNPLIEYAASVPRAGFLDIQRLEELFAAASPY
jgi:hypothetical protein